MKPNDRLAIIHKSSFYYKSYYNILNVPLDPKWSIDCIKVRAKLMNRISLIPLIRGDKHRRKSYLNNYITYKTTLIAQKF